MAGGTVKSVSVVYQAFTDKFENAVNRAGDRMGGFVKKAAGMAAAFLAARAGLEKFTQNFEELNRLAVESQQLDVEPEFLRAMQRAVEDLGGSAENAQDIIREFNVRLGEAKMGAGPLVEALEALGMSVEDFQGLSPEKSLMKYLDALGNLEDQQKKAFLAGEGGGGPLEDFIGLTDLGTEGIEKLKKSIAETQGPISQDDLSMIQDANKSINDMWDSLDGIVNQVLIMFAPALKEIANWFKEILKEISAVVKKWREWQKELEDTLAYALGGDAAVQTEIGERAKKDEGTGDTVGGMKGAIADLDAAFGDIDEITKDLFKDLEKFKATSTKSFSEAITAQSSKAFDVLNPNRANSVQSQILNTNRNIEVNTAVLAEAVQDGGTFIRQDIL